MRLTFPFSGSSFYLEFAEIWPNSADYQKFRLRMESLRLYGGGCSPERIAVSLHFPAIKQFYRQKLSVFRVPAFTIDS